MVTSKTGGHKNEEDITTEKLPLLGDIIHTTQTGFLENRSIVDNVITFWEYSAWAEEQGVDLAVMLLDFEKAYDRISWEFLEAVMDALGFEQQWIHGVAAFYRDASSQVLMAGSLGKSFRMTRSVRQGCPLAPYLFIIAAEALHYHIGDRYWQIQSLPLPEDAGMMLDTEYADDTTTYVKGDANNLDKLQSAINEFCRG